MTSVGTHSNTGSHKDSLTLFLKTLIDYKSHPILTVNVIELEFLPEQEVHLEAKADRTSTPDTKE